MSDPDDLVLVSADGGVRALGADAQARLQQRAGRFQLVVDTPALLILRRELVGAGRSRILMAGEVVNKMSMLEVINVIANAGWRGDLVVRDEEGFARGMVFDQGALKYARSNHPDDRLGEVLFRNGLLDRAQLQALLRKISPEKRLGQLCIDDGLLDQDQLFQTLQKQAEQIFYGTLLVADGAYSFSTIDDNALPPTLTMHIPIQGLLMEGVQRIDEMALFRERVPSAALVPVVRSDAPDKKLEGHASVVLGRCDGSRSIEDIARETGLGEFHTTKTIYHLLQARQIELHSPATVDEGAVRALLSAFNDVMRDIFMAVATYGGIDNTRGTLATWIQGSGYAMYFGAGVQEDGSIDASHVLDVLRLVKTERPIEGLHQALHELAAFALFSASTTLPRGQELSLARDVNRRLKSIRL